MEFSFTKDYILENNSVRLTPLKTSHINSLLKISNDDFIWTYFFENGMGLSNLKKYVQNALENRVQKKEYPFIVFDKRTNQFAGKTRLYEYSPELKTIKIGHTWYGKDFRNSHVNKNCKYLLFNFVFDKLQLERVGFGAYADNKISIKALKSVGCKQEGFLRNMFPSINGIGRTDAILMSILKEEWQLEAKENLKQKLKDYNHELC